MDTSRAIIIAAIIISLSIFLSNGIYAFSPTTNWGIAHRYNKITGSVEVCEYEEGCKSFDK